MRKFYFDMDGTIADLYNENDWLEKLLSETKGLFRNLKVMHDKNRLAAIIEDLQEMGCEVGIITWTPKNVSEDYLKIVENEKIEWVKEHFPMINEIYVLNYGTPKQKANFKKGKEIFLIDDNEDVLKMWETPKQRKIIKADENLIEKLQALVY